MLFKNRAVSPCGARAACEVDGLDDGAGAALDAFAPDDFGALLEGDGDAVFAAVFAAGLAGFAAGLDTGALASGTLALNSLAGSGCFGGRELVFGTLMCTCGSSLGWT
eukprot:scaffold2339_cov368-Prasinococcus_capsulatus_cf.AAC.4